MPECLKEVLQRQEEAKTNRSGVLRGASSVREYMCVYVVASVYTSVSGCVLGQWMTSTFVKRKVVLSLRTPTTALKDETELREGELNNTSRSERM